MPDSWIDKDELDELVKSLPSSGKVRRRIPASVRRAAERSHSRAKESPSGDEVPAEPPQSEDGAPIPAPGFLVESAEGPEAIEWEEETVETVETIDMEPEHTDDFGADAALVDAGEPGGGFEWAPDAEGQANASFGFAAENEDASPQTESVKATDPLTPSLFALDDESEEEWEADGWVGGESWEEGSEGSEGSEGEFAVEGVTELGSFTVASEESEEEADAGANFLETTADPIEDSPMVAFMEEPPFRADDPFAPEQGGELGNADEEGPKIVLAEHPVEGGRRELPGFLDESDEWFSPRSVSLSERDADRALVALAEARIRAERAQLIRPRFAANPSAKTVPAPTEESEEEQAEALAPPLPTKPTEPFEALGMVDAIEPTALPEPPWDEDRLETSNEAAPAEATPAEAEEELQASLGGRLERFGSISRERLGAREVAVCDADGFLLYSDSERTGDSALATALLLDVSTRTSQLLGLEESNATQVSVEDGHWRCLLRGSDGTGGLCAGLLLGRPLSWEEVLRWCDGLAGANEGGSSPLWCSFVEETCRADKTTG